VDSQRLIGNAGAAQPSCLGVLRLLGTVFLGRRLGLQPYLARFHSARWLLASLRVSPVRAPRARQRPPARARDG
jgi:hypothetical protein